MKNIYTCFLAVFMSFNVFFIQGMEESKPNQATPDFTYNLPPETIEWVYTGQLPIDREIKTILFEKGERMPESMVLRLIHKNELYTPIFLNLIRNPKNKNQFFILDPKETGRLLFLGNTPRNLPYTNQESPQSVVPQNQADQTTSFRNLPNQSKSAFGKMKWEKEQYNKFVAKQISIGKQIQKLRYLANPATKKLKELKEFYRNSPLIQRFINKIDYRLEQNEPNRQIAHTLLNSFYSVSPDEKNGEIIALGEIYNVLFDQNTSLPTFFEYNQIIKNEIIPGDMGQASVELRRLLFDIGFLKEHEIIINQKDIFEPTIEYAIGCIGSANVYPEKVKEYMQIARSLYQTLTDQRASKAILRCHGFDEVVNSEKQYLQYMTLDRIAEILEKLEKKDFLEHTKEELEKSLLTLNILWQRSLDNIRDAKALLSCMSEIRDVIDIAQRLEKLDEEVSQYINQENTSYEPITIKHEIKSETQDKDEEIRQEVTAILKEQGYSDQAIPAPFHALDLPYINDVRLVHDLASSSAQFGIMHYELQKQGYLKAAQLAEDIGYGLFTAGRILVEETTDLVKGMGKLALGTGKFALDAFIDPKQTYFTTTDALNKCYQSIEYSLVKLADFTNMIIHMPEEEVVKFLDEKLTLNAAYDYISNLSHEDTFRLGVQFTVNPWIRAKLLKTLPVCYKAVDGLVSQANKLQRAQKNKQALAIASKFLKERKFLRLYKKAIKSAKPGLGKSFSKTTQITIETLLKVRKRQLSLIYSESVVEEACKILNFKHPEVIGKTKKPFKALEQASQYLKKVDSNSRWYNFRFNPSQQIKGSTKGKCTFDNLKEAIAGIACEEQGLLSELIREPSGKSEFIDKFGKLWDVKTPTSYALNGRKIFNTPKGIMLFSESLKKSILKDAAEHLIIDLTHLHESDHSALYDILKKLSVDDLRRMIVVDERNPLNSKTTKALLKFLGY